MIYILPLLLLLFFVVLEYRYKINLNQKKTVYKIFLSYFVILMAFRYRVGIDTLNYMSLFELIPSLNNFDFSYLYTRYEPLYYLLNVVSKSIYDDFVVLQIIHVLFINILISRFLWKNTEYILTVLLLYLLYMFFYFNTEVIRESIAVAIFINAILLLNKGRVILYYLCIVVAMGFHTSSIIALFVPLLYKIRLNTFFCVICVCFVAVTGLLNMFAVNYISDYLPVVAGDKFIRYTGIGMPSLKTILATTIQYALFPTLLLLGLKINKIQFKYENMVCLGILAGLGTIYLTILFSRIYNYFIIFNIILVVTSIFEMRRTIYKRVVVFVVLIYSAITIKYNYFIDPGLSIPAKKHLIWYPYHSVFNKQIEPRRELYRNEYF